MIDARIPVTFAARDAAPNAAFLIEGDRPTPANRPAARFRLPPAQAAHPPACACCAPAGPAADALRMLFLQRARGDVPFFTSVVAILENAAAEAAVRAALADDPVVAARYRLGSST